MITQVCGFKDEEGKFFDTKAKAFMSNIAAQIHKELYNEYGYNPYNPSKAQVERILNAFAEKQSKGFIAELFNIQASDL